MSRPTVYFNSMRTIGDWVYEHTATARETVDRTKPTPHCDCRKYRMKPTKATPQGDCVLCGYAVMWIKLPPPPPPRTKPKNPNKNRHRRKKVVGVNLATKEVVHFPSATAATEAGFGHVSVAINKGYVLKGWQWAYETKTAAAAA